MSFRFHLDIEAEVGNFTNLLSTPSLLITNPDNVTTNNILYYDANTKLVSYGLNIGPSTSTLNNVLTNGNTTDLTALFQDTLISPTITNTISYTGMSSNHDLYLASTANDIQLTTNNLERMRIINGGNVGIGESNPAKILDVNGDALIHTLTIGLGNSSLSGNTALGNLTLNATTTGDLNTAVGYQALYNNTTGNCNTAIGYNALASNTTGGNNVAIGYQALASNTRGNYNNASGQNALSSNTT